MLSKNFKLLTAVLSSVSILSLLILSALQIPLVFLAIVSAAEILSLVLLSVLCGDYHYSNNVNGYVLPPMIPSRKDEIKMRRLYERVSIYMDDKKPYLHDSFSMKDLARAVYTNKAYLSRTISIHSGRNFKQFVNGYRVKHAVELIDKNPRFTVMELASLCGFHSVVSFNTAFSLNMNETPGAYIKSKKLPKLKKDS